MSTHEAKVVRLEKIESHPDPETVNLGIVRVWDYQVVVNKHQWKEGDLAVYIEPDNLCDGNRSEFSFLNKEGKPPQKHRIKVRRLRGIWSEGLLVPAPEGMKEDDNAWDFLGLERYIPKASGRKGFPADLDSDYTMSGAWEKAPVKLPFSKYDLENFKKWNKVFKDGEMVYVSEKIHGCNSRFHWTNDRLYVGSRSGWKKEDEKCSWWQAACQNDWVKNICKLNPNIVFFGEIFGQVQDLKYGAQKNQIFLRLFDGFDIEKREWISTDTFLSLPGIDVEKHTPPILYCGPYSKEKILEVTDGPSMIPGANHVREGCVIKPATEMIHPRLGRTALKNVSNLYLERA